MTTPRITRGERNNNPGNIDRTAERWQGMAADQSDDYRFVVFSNPVWGIRALAKLVMNYQKKYQLNTVREIINRWAPPVENDTGAYTQAVARRVGVDLDDPIDTLDPKTLRSLVIAIITHENGRCVYTSAVIDEGIARALS